MKTPFPRCFRGGEKILDWEHFFNDRSLSILRGCEQEVSENKMSKEEIKNNRPVGSRIRLPHHNNTTVQGISSEYGTFFFPTIAI